LITLEEIKDRPGCVQVKILYIARLQEPNTNELALLASGAGEKVTKFMTKISKLTTKDKFGTMGIG